jgi:hypothetical protein
LFVERLQYYHDGLGIKRRTKQYDKVVEMVGRLREKYPCASKLYDVTVVPEDKPGKQIKAAAIVWKKREQFDQISKFDGCYVLRTDRVELSDVKEQDRMQRHHLRLCSTAEPEHKQIYRNPGISEVPLPRKLYAVE